jgi:hypothetical protein
MTAQHVLPDRTWHIKIRAYLTYLRGLPARADEIAAAINCPPERARFELALMRARGQVTRAGTAHRGWQWTLTEHGRAL